MKAVKKKLKTEIDVKNLTPKTFVSLHPIKRFIQAILKEEKIKTSLLTLLFVSDSYIKALNKKYRLKDSSTDVLSFDLGNGPALKGCVAGDIVVSVDAARISSKALHSSFKEELYRYIIHGILHLTGYDDTTSIQRKKMWKRQEFYLKKHIGPQGFNVSMFQVK